MLLTNTIYFPDWYWIVKDTTPGTNVFSTATSPPQYVANNNASFLSWLARDVTGAASGNGTNMPIISAANNGGGKTRLTLKDTSQLTTGQRFWFGATNGVQQITVISGTTIDLLGLNFSLWVSTPSMLGATIIDTQANLAVLLNRSSFTSSNAGSAVFTSAVNITLANQMALFITVNMTAGGKKVILPPMNASNSIAVGTPFVIYNNLNIANFQFDVVAQDGTTLIATINPGDTVEIINQDNSTANGTLQAFITRIQQDKAGVKGLRANSTGANTSSISWDMATIQDISGVTTGISAGGSIVNDISVAGPAANGRDQAGAFAANSSVHFYLIWGVTAGVATLASNISPQLGGFVPSMPTGYTNWAYLYSVVLNGAGQLPIVNARDDRVAYQARQLIVNAGAAVAETAVSVATLVPAVASEFDIFVDSWGVTADAGGIASSLLHLGYITAQDTHVPQMLLTGGALDAVRQAVGDITMPNPSQSFHYHQQVLNGTAPATTISVPSYRVPNNG